jgi:hypothetical protein
VWCTWWRRRCGGRDIRKPNKINKMVFIKISVWGNLWAVQGLSPDLCVWKWKSMLNDQFKNCFSRRLLLKVISVHIIIVIIIYFFIFILVYWLLGGGLLERPALYTRSKRFTPSRMVCAVLISVIFCSSVADRWHGSNWRFWSNSFLIVPNAQFIIVLTFHNLLTFLLCYHVKRLVWLYRYQASLLLFTM